MHPIYPSSDLSPHPVTHPPHFGDCFPFQPAVTLPLILQYTVMKKATFVISFGLLQLVNRLDFVTRFFNSFPQPDFNFKGHFYEKEFIEHIEWKIITSRAN